MFVQSIAPPQTIDHTITIDPILFIELRRSGRPRPATALLHLAYPAHLLQSAGDTTLDNFITHLVEQEVAGFHRHQREQRLLPFMTNRQVEAGG